LADILYRGPSDIDLGMRRVGTMLLIGVMARIGNADNPAFELIAYRGASRIAQTPQLFLDDELVRQAQPLSQIAHNPVVHYRIRSSRTIMKRAHISASASFTDWRGEGTALAPDQALSVSGAVHFDLSAGLVS
jgi:hypothetical protein